MIEIEKPQIKFEESKNGSMGTAIFEPLEKGFGITLGNAMRRVLLGSLPGCAPIAIKIAGVDHEFQSIDGIKEDITDIVLNIKELALRSSTTDNDFKTTLHLKAKGPQKVTAADIEFNDQVEIINKDLFICTLEEGASIDMEILVARGRGYVPFTEHKDSNQPIGYIGIDSLFSPVVKVAYNVENARVGQDLNYDKLILDVETKGNYSAKEVIALSAKILQEHIGLFIELVENVKDLNILTNREEDQTVKLLEMSIDDMELSVRSHNCLKRAGINTVEDLTKKSRNDMLKVRNLGLKSLEEVIAKVESYGLKLRSDDE